MIKTLLIIASLLGGIGVALGAFGAHGLEGKVDISQLQTWETAVKYQMFHVLGIFLLVILQKQFAVNLQTPAVLFLVGIILFSGSLYLLATKDVIGLGGMSKVLGPITPLGGLMFIIGWFLTAFTFIRNL